MIWDNIVKKDYIPLMTKIIRRRKDDYYATPPAEVFNILDTMGLICGKNSIMLESCCGGGRILEGIENPRIHWIRRIDKRGQK